MEFLRRQALLEQARELQGDGLFVRTYVEPLYMALSSREVVDLCNLADRWNRAVEMLIPGGSEYIDEPELVVAAIQARQESERKLHRKMLEKVRSNGGGE